MASKFEERPQFKHKLRAATPVVDRTVKGAQRDFALGAWHETDYVIFEFESNTFETNVEQRADLVRSLIVNPLLSFR